MTDKTAEDLAVPDIWYKGKRVLRTSLATLISALSVWAGFAAIWPDIAAAVAGVLPDSWIVWLTGAVVAVNAVAMAITAIMTIPRVNAWLVKIGFGSVPESSLVKVEVTKPSGAVAEVVAVKEDPKAITPEGTPRHGGGYWNAVG